MPLPESDLRKFLEAAVSAAKAGGAVHKQYWGKALDIQDKAFPGDLVTQVDKLSEEAILNLLQEKFPSHAILSEESGMQAVEGADFLWVVDPLDGTTNYTHQHPMVAVSIGLLYQGEPIVGVVYNPIYQELFQSAIGLGAQLNGSDIHVSNTKNLPKSLLGTGFAYDRQATADNNYAEFCHMTNLSQGVRRLGAAALDLAFVAAGRLDGFWERGLSPWDIAAGAVLIKEAGGRVSAYDLGPLDLKSGRILATNGLIHEQLSEELERTKLQG